MEPTVLLAQEVTRLKEQLILKDAVIRNLQDELVSQAMAHEDDMKVRTSNFRLRADEIAAERDGATHEVVTLRQTVATLRREVNQLTTPQRNPT